MKIMGLKFLQEEMVDMVGILFSQALEMLLHSLNSEELISSVMMVKMAEMLNRTVKRVRISTFKFLVELKFTK